MDGNDHVHSDDNGTTSFSETCFCVSFAVSLAVALEVSLAVFLGIFNDTHQ